MAQFVTDAFQRTVHQSIDADRVLSNIDESDVLGRGLDYYFSIAITTDSEFIDNISLENIKRLNA